MKHTKLTIDDRNQIKALLDRGIKPIEIARVMKRAKSTISEEIERGRRSDSSRYGPPGEYDPEIAQQKAYVRRKYAKYQGMKIMGNTGLKMFIDNALLELQSPEAIAGRLALGRDLDESGEVLPRVSRSCIEKYITSIHGEAIRIEIKAMKKLYQRRTRRKTPAKLDGRKFIDERPQIIQDRGRLGDLEVDFIVSGRGGSGSLLSATDRKGRFSFIRKLYPVTVENLKTALLDIRAYYPRLKSITTDNDILFACHKQLEELLDIPIYFCHPYSSWEKGSVENLNKYIRKFIHKGSNISSYSRQLIRAVEQKANSRFMGVIGYLTPTEFLEQELQKTA
jgi:IS30 family transposase